MRRINKAELNSVEEHNEWAYVVHELFLLYGIRTLEAWRKHVCLTGTVQSREIRNTEENIYECNIWQGEKLRFLPCRPEELCGVSKGSSTPEEPQRTLDSLQTGKSRRKQMIWYIWWYFPCLKSAEGEAPESFTQPTTWTLGRKWSPFTLSNTPHEQVTFWALWTLFMPQKSQRNFALNQFRYSILILKNFSQSITDLHISQFWRY